jgi:hypothetical protein
MVSDQFVSKFKSVSKIAYDNSQMVSELISLRNKIEFFLKMASND